MLPELYSQNAGSSLCVSAASSVALAPSTSASNEGRPAGAPPETMRCFSHGSRCTIGRISPISDSLTMAAAARESLRMNW